MSPTQESAPASETDNFKDLLKKIRAGLSRMEGFMNSDNGGKEEALEEINKILDDEGFKQMWADIRSKLAEIPDVSLDELPAVENETADKFILEMVEAARRHVGSLEGMKEKGQDLEQGLVEAGQLRLILEELQRQCKQK